MGNFDLTNGMIRPISNSKTSNNFYLQNPAGLILLGKIAWSVGIISQIADEFHHQLTLYSRFGGRTKCQFTYEYNVSPHGN